MGTKMGTNLDIIKAHQTELQAIHDFLEFMQEQGYVMLKVEEPSRSRLLHYDAIHTGQKLARQLADFYGFDYDAAEKERQDIIDSL